MNRQQAIAELAHSPNGPGLAHILALTATALIQTDPPDGPVSLYYHQTPVITWDRDGSVTLAHGGHLTATTAKRINTFLDGAQVYRENGAFYVWRPATPNRPALRWQPEEETLTLDPGWLAGRYDDHYHETRPDRPAA